MKKISLYAKHSLIYFLLLFVFQSSAFAQKIQLDKEWTSNLKSFLEGAPTVADIDNDGRDEILVAGQKEMIVPDRNEPTIWNEYEEIIKKSGEQFNSFGFIERFRFYNRAKEAFAVVATSESALYANIILRKGVIV